MIKEAIMKTWPVLFLAWMICISPSLQAQDDAAQRLYQEGIFQMEALGDFSAAIERFEKLVAEHPHNKSLAGRALLMAGRCYERLGQQEAENTYNRILEEYSDQRELVSEARARLMLLSERASLAGQGGMRIRKLWEGPVTCITATPSPDERYVVFTDWPSGNLALRDLHTGQVRRLTDKGKPSESPAHALFPVFSPDSRYIAFTWYDENYDCSLRILDLETQEIQVFLADQNLSFLQAFEWSPDAGSIVLITMDFEQTFLGLFQIAKAHFSLLKTYGHFNPEKITFSPDGKYIAYERSPPENSALQYLYIADIDRNEHHELVAHPSWNIICGWAPEGPQLVFISDRTGVNAIWTQRVRDGKAAGAPRMLKTDISQGATPIRLTPNGSLYYGLDTGGRDVYTAPFTPEETEPFGPPAKISLQFQGSNRTPAWSNCGRFIAYTAARQKRNIYYSNAVVIHDTETGLDRTLVLNVEQLFDRLEWSPDDKFLALGGVIARNDQQQQAQFILDASGLLITHTIEGGPSGHFSNPVWSADGKSLYFFRGDYAHLMSYTLMERNLDTGQETPLLSAMEDLEDSAHDQGYQLVGSPDANMLAFLRVSPRQQKSELFLVDLAAGKTAPRTLLTLRHPQVIRRVMAFEDHKIYYIKSLLDQDENQRDPELWWIDLFTRETQRIVPVPEAFRYFSLHPDGKTALFNLGPRMKPCEVWVIDNLLP